MLNLAQKVALVFAAFVASLCMAACPRHNLETVYHGDGSAKVGYHTLGSLTYAVDLENFDMVVGG